MDCFEIVNVTIWTFEGEAQAMLAIARLVHHVKLQRAVGAYLEHCRSLRGWVSVRRSVLP